MSKIIKGVGKVFKKVIKVAKKVLPIALAVGAVVFTGGAALGLTPTFAGAIGGVVAKLGIGGAVAGALTGAVTSAGFGAALGGVTGGMKGMQQGALMGALTGGALGALSPSTFGIVRGADGAWTTANTIRTGSAFGAAGSGNEIARNATTGFYERVASTGANAATGSGLAAGMQKAVPGTMNSAPTLAARTMPGATNLAMPAGMQKAVGPMMSGGLNGGGAIGGVTGAAGAATVPVGTPPIAGITPAAAPAQGGVMGFLNQNPLIAGQVLSRVGAGLSGGDGNSDLIRERAEEERKSAQLAYGNIYSSGSAFGQKPYAPPPARWVYNPETNAVEEVRV